MSPVTPEGTPESIWQQWWQEGAGGAVAALDLTALGLTALSSAVTSASDIARVVVLAAHPDDEVLAVGGLCRRLHDEGVPLTFVWASDGGAAFDGVAGVSFDDLSSTRRREAVGGLAALGVMPSPTRFLGLPDGGLVDHVDDLQEALDDVVGETDVLLAPWSHDRHPDHEVCGRVASDTRAARVLHYPVWLWHWAVPGDPAVPWQQMRAETLSPQRRTAKAAAVAEHVSQVTVPGSASQVGAVLPPSVLAYFQRSMEVVFA